MCMIILNNWIKVEMYIRICFRIIKMIMKMEDHIGSYGYWLKREWRVYFDPVKIGVYDWRMADVILL